VTYQDQQYLTSTEIPELNDITRQFYNAITNPHLSMVETLKEYAIRVESINRILYVRQHLSPTGGSEETPPLPPFEHSILNIDRLLQDLVISAMGSPMDLSPRARSYIQRVVGTQLIPELQEHRRSATSVLEDYEEQIRNWLTLNAQIYPDATNPPISN
jgi:hypothetical protein